MSVVDTGEFGSQPEIEIEAAQALLSQLLPDAGARVMKAFEQTDHGEIQKDNAGDFTTRTDLEIDKFLIENIQAGFPNANFLTEETSKEVTFERFRELENLFVIDPIDGTGNFDRHNPNFGMSVALVQRGVPQLAAIYLPAARRLITAQIDQPGIEVNDQHANWHVSDVAALNQATVLLDTPHNKVLKPYTAYWLRELDAVTRRTGKEGSAVADMMKLARGDIDTYVHPGLLPWDVAAACLILEKAGATITRSDGSPWDIFSPDIVASNGHIHQAILNQITSTPHS